MSIRQQLSEKRYLMKIQNIKLTYFSLLLLITNINASLLERTLAIIKPDAVQAQHDEAIIEMIKKNKFEIRCIRKLTLTQDEAASFYEIHKEKPFFSELVTYMTSGPIIVLTLEKDNAIQEWRNLMGNTDPQKAAPGTIRNLFGTDKGINAAHGSDAPETAKHEIEYFFPSLLKN